MTSLKLNISTTLLMLIMVSAAYGQGTGKITGNVKDVNTHENIPYATVALLYQQSKATVRGLQTDTNGNFVLENLPVGTFMLRIGYVGDEDIVKENIVINSNNPNLDLGTLLMNTSKNNSLKEVEITGKKAALQITDGKKVFSVNQSLVSKGGNAADLLQNVPTLQIDVNGNVSLRGSTGVKVLIDGKLSVIGNEDIAQLLQSIPASSIENIEVITNPSAKYDAEGVGIINIVLKKNSRPGLNGSVEFAGGTRDNYNGNANLSYQKDKVNLYANYSIKDGNTYSTGIQYLTFFQPTDSIKYTTERFPSITRNKIQFVKAGIDYSLTPGSTLGISASFNSSSRHRNELISFTDYSISDALIESYNRYNTVNNNGNNYEFDVDYNQHFKKLKEELTFNFAYAYGSYSDDEGYTTHFNSINGVPPALSADTPLISNTRHNATNYNIQADYILPAGKSGQFSAGYRSQITMGNNDQYAYNVLGTGVTPLYKFTAFFNGSNQVHAVYLNFRDRIGDFSYQAGVRAEDSHLNANFTGYNANNLLFTTPVKVPSKGIYPSILLTQKLENNSQVQFSFAERVLKPTGREVNSTIDFSDPANYYIGNPVLTPESITNLEFNYNKTWQNISFTSGIYYNRINNIIQHIQTEPVNDETTTTPENLKSSTTTGLELISHIDMVKGWDLNVNANFYERDNDAAPQFGIAANNGFSWNANVTTNITPIQRLSFQIRADYRASDYVVQDKNRAAFGMDAAAKYDFAGNRASLSLNATDIFNSRIRAFIRSSDDLILDWQRQTVSSRATLTFSYRFGARSGAPNPAKQYKRIEDTL
jgi:ferric enterobactin receptor